MKEEFLHFIWRFQRIRYSTLRTVKGKEITVVQPGFPNQLHSGPDFSEATILIDGVKWYGHVEIHLKSSDWNAHGHQDDPAYNNVILHVVYNDDKEILTENGNRLPTLELRGKIQENLKSVYRKLTAQSHKVPCRHYLSSINSSAVKHWFDRVAYSRLERKAEDVVEILMKTNGDWEKTYITLLAKYLGFKVNAGPFVMLAEKIDWKWIQKNSGKTRNIEAYLFGLAGFLSDEPKDDYQKELKVLYDRLANMHSLNSLPVQIWKFSRMRPDNFPSLRIAELASFFHVHGRLWADLRVCSNIDEYRSHLDVPYSKYWQNHYKFGKESKRKRKSPGEMSRNLLLINLISPMLYAYGKVSYETKYQERAMDIWQELPPENNRIIRMWSEEGLEASSAWDTQALIELKAEYCNQKKCMDCHIGKSILLELPGDYSKSNNTTRESKIIKL